MNKKLSPTTDPALEAVRKQFEIWRAAKKGGERIPEALWQAAVELTCTHTLTNLCKTLGLNYTRLKNRVEASEDAHPTTMEPDRASDSPLEAVRKQFETWRAAKKGNERIPEALWQAVENLAKTVSLGKIAETLSLSHTRLKDRVHGAQIALPIKKESSPGTAPILEEVRAQFETFRESRKAGEPIPEALWKAAVDLRKTHTLHMISRTLSLDYESLKDRVHAAPPGLPIGKDQAPAFIELDFGTPFLSSEWLIEMENRNGEKMRMQMKGQNGFDPMDICKAFWRRDA